MKTNQLFISKLFVLRYFALGVFFALFLHIGGSCIKDKYNPDPTDNVDVTKIHDGAKLVESAFISGNAGTVISVLTADAAGLYGADLRQVSPDQLTGLGESLKTREIKVYTDMYAEYEYRKGGVAYTIAMARQEDGSWKLMRF